MTDGPHLDEKDMHIMGHCTHSQMLKVDVDANNCWFNPGSITTELLVRRCWKTLFAHSVGSWFLVSVTFG